MTKLTLTNALPENQWWPEYFEPNDISKINSSSATNLRWKNDDGSIVEMKGTGFAFVDGVAVDGVVSSITVKQGGNTLMSATKIGKELVDLFDWAFGYEQEGQDRRDGDGFQFITSLLNGNDTIIGSDNGDDIVGGRNPGNDTIDARGGDDFVKGDAGKDSIDGGDGDSDILTYQESFSDPTAFKGITLDVAGGTVADSWGFVDTIKNFEEYRGSRFKDLFIGSDGDERFMGLRGKDDFQGGDGFDSLQYHRDARYGGMNGIVVDLAAGKIADGWGSIDTVSGIEEVGDTIFADQFVGSDSDDFFVAGAGIDTFDGGLGIDEVNCEGAGEQLSGASVDLALASGQIINDGWNNTESVVSIERIDGSDWDDSILGSNDFNVLHGDGGNDTINGRGGSDEIAGNAGQDILTGGSGGDEFRYNRRAGQDPWGDTITDFKSGSDKIDISSGDFAGMDGILRFVNGNSAGGTGSWFFFNAANDGLFWDADGTAAGAAILVATLTGVNALQASDIVL